MSSQFQIDQNIWKQIKLSKSWLVVLTQTNITEQEKLKPMQQKWMQELKLKKVTTSHPLFALMYTHWPVL